MIQILAKSDGAPGGASLPQRYLFRQAAKLLRCRELDLRHVLVSAYLEQIAGIWMPRAEFVRDGLFQVPSKDESRRLYWFTETGLAHFEDLFNGSCLEADDMLIAA